MLLHMSLMMEIYTVIKWLMSIISGNNNQKKWQKQMMLWEKIMIGFNKRIGKNNQKKKEKLHKKNQKLSRCQMFRLIWQISWMCSMIV